MHLYNYLVEEEKEQQELNSLEDYFKRLSNLKETLDLVIQYTDESTLKKIQEDLTKSPDLSKALKSNLKQINKKDLDTLINTKESVLYSIFVTFKSKQDFDEQIKYTANTLSVIHENKEYTLEELSKLINSN